MVTIDAHHHVWKLGIAPYAWMNAPAWQDIRRDFPYRDLTNDLIACGIQKSILVQADNTTADSDYLKSVAAMEDGVCGWVGWAPLTEPEKIDDALDRLADSRMLVGLRHVLSFEADDDWILRPDVGQSLRALERRELAFDFNCDRPTFLRHVPALARSFPNLHLVINHAGKPPIGDRGWEPWATDIGRAAQYANVYVKISGLTTPYREGWSGEDFRPYVEHVADRFGPGRMMYASNWPVTLVAGSYRQQWEATKFALNSLSESDLDLVFGGTAVTCYRLPTKDMGRG
jgi:L-fuconolactonase